jgi:hypothetical protein
MSAIDGLQAAAQELSNAQVKIRRLLAAAEMVCWFDWSGNDPDAVAAVETLRQELKAE